MQIDVGDLRPVNAPGRDRGVQGGRGGGEPGPGGPGQAGPLPPGAGARPGGGEGAAPAAQHPRRRSRARSTPPSPCPPTSSRAEGGVMKIALDHPPPPPALRRLHPGRLRAGAPLDLPGRGGARAAHASRRGPAAGRSTSSACSLARASPRACASTASRSATASSPSPSSGSTPRSSCFPLLIGRRVLDFQASVFGGTIGGSAALSGESRRVELAVADVDLARALPLRKATRLELGGILSGTVDLTVPGGALDKASGRIELAVAQAGIAGGQIPVPPWPAASPCPPSPSAQWPPRRSWGRAAPPSRSSRRRAATPSSRRTRSRWCCSPGSSSRR